MDEIFEHQIAIEKLFRTIEKVDLDSYSKVDKKGLVHYKNISKATNRRSIEDIMGEEDDF